MWSEGDNFDLALSFQEKAGCDEIWEKICAVLIKLNFNFFISFCYFLNNIILLSHLCQVQGKDPSVEVTQDIIEESEDERFDDISDHIPPIELPPCEIIHLEEIKEVIFKSVF